MACLCEMNLDGFFCIGKVFGRGIMGEVWPGEIVPQLDGCYPDGLDWEPRHVVVKADKGCHYGEFKCSKCICS